MRIRLLPLIERAHDLFVEQGHIPPLSEIEAQDMVARCGNGQDRVRIIVGPQHLYARCRHGHTSALRIMPGEGPEEVRALGQIAAAILRQRVREKLATA